MPKFTNTFTGGMDRDTVPTSYKNNNYYYAKNFSIVVADDLSSATLTNTKGITTRLTLTPLSMYDVATIVGVASIDDSLVIFVKGSSTTGYIYKVPFTVVEGRATTPLELVGSIYLLTYNSFNFGSRVEAVAREETSSIKKLYWVDGINPLRYCNVSLGSTVLNGYTIDQFEAYQNVKFTTPTFSRLISGNLKCGMYQYSYCLYNQNTNQTVYSPPSGFIQVSPVGLTTLPTYFQGGDIGEESTTGIQVAISDTNTNYAYIRVVALYYSTQESVPEVTIIYEGAKTSSMTISHTGAELLGTITADEVVVTPNILTPKTIASKFNYLFVGNIEESKFDADFDARAYRYFSGENYFTLYDSDTTYAAPGHYINYIYPNFPEIDDYSYTLSPKNVISWDSSGNVNANRQSNGSTLGGTGKNVQYNFITKSITYKEVSSGMGLWRNSGGYADPANNSYVGYQRDEVYRFGIVFFNSKGQQSFVKWINDIRFPRMSDSGFAIATFSTISSSTQFSALGIHFDFNFTGIDSDINSYQIVRVERGYSDATVVDCGYVGNLYSYSGSTMTFGQINPYVVGDSTEFKKPGIDPSGVTSYRYLLEYICPETNYNKNNYAPYERLDTYTGTSSHTIKTTASGKYLNDNNMVVTSILPVSTFNSYNTIDNSTLFRNQSSLTASQSFEGFTILTKSAHTNAGSRGYKGSTMVLKLDADLLPTSGYSNQPHYALRRRIAYPYGGYSESALNSSKYYPCSPVMPITTTSIDVWGGDTYITNFEYIRVLWADMTGSTMSTSRYMQVVQCLVESKLNLDYTVNEKWSKYDSNTQLTSSIMTADYTYMGMQELSGVHPFYLNGNPPLYFTQEKDLYTYNPVYSVTTGSKAYFPKPTNFTENSTFPTRIYKSLVKINGETTDSWLQFLPNSYKDLDNQFGDLSRLYNHNNNIFYFQDKAFGIIPVNDREVISTSTGASTTIGTGGALERFDYASTNAGTSIPDSIAGTDSNLYFVDSNLKKICRWNGDEGVSYISDVKGVYSYMSSKVLTSVSTLYNPRSKEILFSFTDETLVYNEYLNSFTGFSSTIFTGGTFESKYCYITGISQNGKGAIGTLLTGNYGKYTLHSSNNPTTTDSTLEIISNPARNTPARFDMMELATEYFQNGTTNLPTATFSTLRVRNNYQDTGTITLTPSTNIVRRFRTWRYNQLRDTLDATNTGRLIDNYARVLLTFTNNGTDKLVVNDISTIFTPLNINRNM